MASIILAACKKGGNGNSTNPYNGDWKILVLQSGCGFSQPLDVVVASGAFSVSSFGITCTPLVSYNYGISGVISSSGAVSGMLTSINYGPPVSFSGVCPLADSCSATGSGMSLTMTK